jgi:hypothetical protein
VLFAWSRNPERIESFSPATGCPEPARGYPGSNQIKFNNAEGVASQTVKSFDRYPVLLVVGTAILVFVAIIAAVIIAASSFFNIANAVSGDGR